MTEEIQKKTVLDKGFVEVIDKLGSDFRQAASLSIPAVPYASSGVRPARAEWGRPAL